MMLIDDHARREEQQQQEEDAAPTNRHCLKMFPPPRNVRQDEGPPYVRECLLVCFEAGFEAGKVAVSLLLLRHYWTPLRVVEDSFEDREFFPSVFCGEDPETAVVREERGVLGFVVEVKVGGLGLVGCSYFHEESHAGSLESLEAMERARRHAIKASRFVLVLHEELGQVSRERRAREAAASRPRCHEEGVLFAFFLGSQGVDAVQVGSAEAGRVEEAPVVVHEEILADEMRERHRDRLVLVAVARAIPATPRAARSQTNPLG